MQSDDVTLTRTIANLFEFLFKQILSQVIILDAQSKDDMNPSEASRTQKETVSISAAKRLINQGFEIIFTNLRRYACMLDLFKVEPCRLFLQLENQSKDVSQS